MGSVVISASLVSAISLSTAIEDPGPGVDFVLTVDSDTVEPAQHGGDSLAADSVVVRLGGDADHPIDLTSVGESQGDGDSRFEAGEILGHGTGPRNR